MKKILLSLAALVAVSLAYAEDATTSSSTDEAVVETTETTDETTSTDDTDANTDADTDTDTDTDAEESEASAYDPTTVQDLSQWGGSGWSSSFDATTYTITYESAWSGRGIWIGGKDFSAYSSITVSFTSEIASTIKLVVEEYDETNTNSSEFVSASITGSGDATAEQSITVTLGESATNLSQMYIQAGATGTLTLTSVVLKTADEEEPQAEVVELYTTSTSVWQSDDDGTYYYELPYTLSGWSGTYLGVDANNGTPELISSGLAEAGNMLVLTFTDIMEVTEDASWGFKLVEGHWGDTYVAINYYGSDEVGNEFDAYDLVANNGVYALELTEAIITTASSGQYWGGEFIVQGDGLTLSKVEIMTADYYAANYPATSSIKNILADQIEQGDGKLYNLAGQVVDESYRGIVICNGKKFLNK